MLPLEDLLQEAKHFQNNTSENNLERALNELSDLKKRPIDYWKSYERWGQLTPEEQGRLPLLLKDVKEALDSIFGNAETNKQNLL